jgi:hypothetical protein
MKKILAMFLLMPSLAFAEPKPATYETICLNGKDLTNTVNEFKELPFVRGLSVPLTQQERKLSLVIFANPTTGSFTIVEKAGEDLYCILAIGGGFEPVPKGIQDDVKQGQEKSTL